MEEGVPIGDAENRVQKLLRKLGETEILPLRGVEPGSTESGRTVIPPHLLVDLYIEPLAGQPESDLRDTGYPTEYGRAHFGAGGPVARTALCYDRQELIEVFPSSTRVYDVEKSAFEPKPSSAPVSRAAHDEGIPRKKASPARDRALEAIHAKWGDVEAIPSQSDLPNTLLDREVNNWLKEAGKPAVHARTVLRAAGRAT
jgi:hypothetical protein